MSTPIILPATIPVAIYTRVSTQSQVGGRFDSCETQATACRTYLQSMATRGWFEVATITDAAYSGADMNRPGIHALKRLIEECGVKVVLIYRLERILRCTDEWSRFRAFLKRHGCKLVSPNEEFCDQTASGRLRNNVLMSVAEYERLNTAEKVREKMVEQVKRGIWNCGLVPFGYDYDRKAKALIPNPSEAAVVLHIYESVAQLAPFPQVAKELALRGEKTRDRVFKSRNGVERNVGGKAFRTDTLRSIIANPIYAGRLRFHRQEYPGSHRAIVSADLWERANAAMDRPAPRALQCDPRRNKHGHFLKGIIQCGICGRTSVPYRAGRRRDGQHYHYYTCDYAHNVSAGRKCAGTNIPAAFLESGLLEVVDQCGRHSEILEAAVKLSETRVSEDTAAWRQELEKVDAKLSEIARQMRNCAHAVQWESFDTLKDELRVQVATLAAEKQGLLVARERLSQRLQSWNLELADLATLRSDLQQFGTQFSAATPEQRIDIARALLGEIVLTSVHRDKPKGAIRSLRLDIKLQVISQDAGNEKPRRPVRLDVVVPGPRSKVKNLTFFPGDSEITITRMRIAASQPPTAVLHPLHRALRWGLRLRTEPSLKRITLAREEQVCPATITHHLKLLRLAPEIQVKLLGVTTQADLEKYSLNKMKALADLPVQEQLDLFGRN
jgi:DNA invertase Pin-like site-specific DNA recombinase